jgi:hypothetical protein
MKWVGVMAELDRILDRELREGLEKKFNLHQMHAILLKYRDRGFSSESVQELLRSILDEFRRSGVSEDIEDGLLDVMDLACGWCSPHLKVW